jgi:hypothetical protein
LIPSAFFILSLNGGGADLSVPTFSPYTMHNVRYGFPGFVFVASASSALVTLLYRRRWIAAAVLVGAALIPWFTIGPICWREARDNSKTRRKAQNQATATLEVKVPNLAVVKRGYLRLTGNLGIRQGHFPESPHTIPLPEGRQCTSSASYARRCFPTSQNAVPRALTSNELKLN